MYMYNIEIKQKSSRKIENWSNESWLDKKKYCKQLTVLDCVVTRGHLVDDRRHIICFRMFGKWNQIPTK